METAWAMVDAKIANPIAVLTLNNPREQNALSRELIDELCGALEDVRKREARVAQDDSSIVVQCFGSRPFAVDSYF